jgi:hypothetical protein
MVSDGAECGHVTAVTAFRVRIYRAKKNHECGRNRNFLHKILLGRRRLRYRIVAHRTTSSDAAVQRLRPLPCDGAKVKGSSPIEE